MAATKSSALEKQKLTTKSSQLEKNVSTTISSLSIVIPLVAIVLGFIGPIITLGFMSYDATRLCSVAPSICLRLNIASPSVTALDRTSSNGASLSATISLEFFNRLPYSIDTYWKDYAGQEQFWFTMEAHSYTGNISSIRGHVWSFRVSESSELLFEEVIDVNHCGKIHIAPAEHIEALRQYCSSTGRAVIGHWPRAPLVRYVPRPSPLGTMKQFQTDHVQFESYEGRLKSDVKEMTIETISTSPHMLRVDNFLSDEECDYLIETSSKRMPSEDTDSTEASSTWLEHGQSPIVSAITRRIFDLMGFDADIETFYFAEKVQINRFRQSQEYLPHYDAMDLTSHQRSLPHNRFATIMIFLNSLDANDGGEEVWPRANGADEFSRPACESEFRLQPKRGSLIVMYSMFGDGVIDESSLHGSCPVLKESKEKWTANMFFWDPFVQWSPEP